MLRGLRGLRVGPRSLIQAGVAGGEVSDEGALAVVHLWRKEEEEEEVQKKSKEVGVSECERELSPRTASRKGRKRDVL